jgi:cobalt-zinc-cadmium efflux system membrane fusion protein
MPRRPTSALAALLLIGQAGAVHATDIKLSPKQMDLMEIKLIEVKEAVTEPVALLPGTVVPALNARIVAAAPFAGTVVHTFVVPGQSVAKDEPLATIASRELIDTLSAIRQAEAELQVADAIARRRRDLATKNIASPTLAEEAEAQVVKLRAVLEQHKRMLSIGSIKVGEGGQYTIAAPEAGAVAEMRATPGATLEAMTPAVAIASSADVWIEAQVPADLVTRIRPGDTVQVIDGPAGQVISISGSLDRTTRSATMVVSVPPDSGLLPGQMVTLSVLRPTETGGLEIPATSVAWIGDQYVVFVKSDGGFTATAVTVRGKSPLGATVAGDMRPGEQVAVSGLPQLEAMLAGE